MSKKLSLVNKNGANCLQLAPFGFVTGQDRTRQISTSFLDDLKILAYYM
ncbi:hypothetical protein ACFFLS_12675 [Flavobacterium procerum]|uniref:Aldo/keto reductase n=1 Tax=Flavobacterium procerum TaxID=1455569 RepID=A0ABV6BR41_9FLAO